MYDLLITNGRIAVNGGLVVEQGAFTGRTPGKVMRSFAD
jgi:hypothetical protein